MAKIHGNPTFSNGISEDYIKSPDLVREFIPNGFDSPKLRDFDVDRSRLVDILEGYNKKIEAPDPVFRNIEKVGNKETYMIVTGQQPGVLTGPLFTVYKALTAISISEELSDKNHSLVPVFWNASEDDDLSEIDHLFLLEDNEPKRIDFPYEEEGITFSSLKINRSRTKGVLRTVERYSPDSEFLEPLMEDLEGIIDQSSTVSGFFSRVMTYLLGDYGLILIEPRCLRDQMVPIFKKVIQGGRKCTDILNKMSSKLENAGYSPRIHKPSGLCNFYHVDESGKRRRIAFEGDHFGIKGEKFGGDELMGMVEEDPSSFSTNAVTRPVAQDFVLPTFGYVAGPSEISYLAQLREVYDFFSVEMPVIYPRYGATIVENKIDKILDKYEIELEDLREPERVLKEIAGRDVDHVLERFRKKVMKEVETIEDEVESVDGPLDSYVSVARNDILKTLDEMEDGIKSELKKKDQIARRQIKKGHNNLFPQDKLQERRLNVFEYLPKFGKKFLGIVYDEFSKAEFGEHRVIRCR